MRTCVSNKCLLRLLWLCAHVCVSPSLSHAHTHTHTHTQLTLYLFFSFCFEPKPEPVNRTGMQRPDQGPVFVLLAPKFHLPAIINVADAPSNKVHNFHAVPSVSASAVCTAQNPFFQQGQVTNQQPIKTRSSMPILCACVVLVFIKIPPESKAAGFVSTKLN